MRTISYRPCMKTAQQIRMENFRILLEEAGSQAELHRRTKVPQPYINQLAKGTKLASGNERSLGDDTARKLEKGMEKPVGWLDKDHSMPMLFSELNGLEGQLVTLYRKLDESGKEDLLSRANELFSERNPQPSAANPYPPRQKAKH